MEMSEAFRGKWRFLVIIVPIVAALLAIVVTASSVEKEFELRSVFSITEFVEAENPAAVRAVTDDFDSALASRAVIDVVRAESPGSGGRITADAVGNGDDVEVTFVADDPDAGERALDIGVREALIELAESERRQIVRDADAAQAQADESLDVLLSIEQRAGAADLDNEAQRRSADILNLRNQIALAVNEPSVRQALQRTLEAKSEELAAIQDQLLVWQSERERYDLSVTSGADAALRLSQLSATQATLRDDPLLTSFRTSETSAVGGLIQAAVGAAIAAALLIIGLALVATGRLPSGSGSQRGRADDGGDEASDGGLDVFNHLEMLIDERVASSDHVDDLAHDEADAVLASDREASDDIEDEAWAKSGDAVPVDQDDAEASDADEREVANDADTEDGSATGDDEETVSAGTGRARRGFRR